MVANGVFFSIFYTWFWIVFAFAFTSVLLAVVRVHTGIRDIYAQSLLQLFAWTHRKYKQVKMRNNRGKLSVVSPKDLIQPQAFKSLSEKIGDKNHTDLIDIVEDALDMTRWGVEVIITDEVTQSFRAQDLASWNLLTRTDRGYFSTSWDLKILLLLGFIFRYGILFPGRLMIFLFALSSALVSAFVLSPIPDSKARDFVVRHWDMTLCRILTRAASVHITYHNVENKSKAGSVSVANHTGMLDFVILGAENQFAIVGQKWGGFTGFVQDRIIGRLFSCVWFERTSKSDRSHVVDAMKNHINKLGPPIQIFPEGVCVNNTTLFRFRKGCFELGAPIYPVAIRYDRRFGEPFYFQEKWYTHLFALMSSWAIKADVYYLPPTALQPNESSIDFARRVKEAIALKGGFLDVDWEGYVNFLPVKQEQILELKKLYSERLRRYNPEVELDEFFSLDDEE